MIINVLGPYTNKISSIIVRIICHFIPVINIGNTEKENVLCLSIEALPIFCDFLIYGTNWCLIGISVQHFRVYSS